MLVEHMDLYVLTFDLNFHPFLQLVVGALVSLEGILFSYGRHKVLGMGVMLQVIGIFMAVIGALLDGVVASMINVNLKFNDTPFICSFTVWLLP